MLQRAIQKPANAINVKTSRVDTTAIDALKDTTVIRCLEVKSAADLVAVQTQSHLVTRLPVSVL
jgi:hypothetical protein